MKKQKLFSLLIAALFIFWGCDKNFKYKVPGPARLDVSTEDNKNKELVANIVKSINEKDAQAIYEMFSDQVKEDVPTLLEDIKKLFSVLDAVIDDYEFYVNFESETQSWGKAIRYNSLCDIFVGENQYCLDIKAVQRHDKFKELEGIRAIGLFKDEHRHSYLQAGITIQEEFLQ